MQQRDSIVHDYRIPPLYHIWIRVSSIKALAPKYRNELLREA
jgi:hypothetical protein